MRKAGVVATGVEGLDLADTISLQFADGQATADITDVNKEKS